VQLTPVSSASSRRAVASTLSPGSISPFGNATTPGRPAGSIAANHQRPRIRRTATPPADSSFGIYDQG
jgi:hypothetical protein